MTKRGGHHTPESREKMRQAHLGRELSPDHREAIGRGHLGHLVSGDARQKMSTAKRGKPLSEQHREALRQASARPEVQEQKRRRATGNKYALGRSLAEATREKLSLANVRRQAVPPSRKGKHQSLEAREKLRQARLRQTFPLTDIEVILRDEFTRRQLTFQMHLAMWDRFQPDFIFGEAKLIVQADGGWWHRLPRSRALDAALEETARARGWTIWRFSDRQIKQDAAAIGRAVAAFVRRRGKQVPPAPSQRPS